MSPVPRATHQLIDMGGDGGGQTSGHTRGGPAKITVSPEMYGLHSNKVAARPASPHPDTTQGSILYMYIKQKHNTLGLDKTFGLLIHSANKSIHLYPSTLSPAVATLCIIKRPLGLIAPPLIIRCLSVENTSRMGELGILNTWRNY